MPQLIVPDNQKTLICDANRYEPRANDTVHDFAAHYGNSFLPARARHPRDKAKVESAVQWSGTGSWRACVMNAWPACTR